LPTRREGGLNRARGEALEAKRSVMGARESQANEIRMKKREDNNAEKGQLSKIEVKEKAKNQKTKLNRKIRKSEQDRLRETEEGQRYMIMYCSICSYIMLFHRQEVPLN
jgi:hypothetical protein